MNIVVPTFFDPFSSDLNHSRRAISPKQAEKLFLFFKQHPLFNWDDANNGCEGKADAVCVLLDEWNIPNYKGWVFSGAFLKNHAGELKQNWKYHVAPILPVEVDGQILHYVLDPATTISLQLSYEWVAAITQVPQSYYFLMESHWYIFPSANISTGKWHTRNKQNRKWMIQCLAGVNGLSGTGKAWLCFNKKRLDRVKIAFEKLKKDNPIL